MADATPTTLTAAQGAIDAVLAAQEARLRRRYLVHGLGWALLLPAAGIALFFGLDHTLHLPLGIRLLHTAATVALLVYGAQRFLLYPLSRRFQRLDIAQVLERTFPELHQRLVSAVQLQTAAAVSTGGTDGLRNQSQALIDALCAETAAAVRALPLERFFDPRRTRIVLGGAGLLLATLGGLTIAAPGTARVFLLRHLGIAVDYPRRTYLAIELPPEGPELQRRDGDGLIELLLPAGSDLHVVVAATGVVPKDVVLDVRTQRDGDEAASGPVRSVPMAPRPGDRFRYVFRKVSGAFEFRARGGDDEGAELLVRVHTVHPPQVATIRAEVTPPAYTGIANEMQAGGGIEALTGSAVKLFVTTTAPVQQAAMVFLESGRRLDLVPTTVQDDSGAANALVTTFTIQKSDRYAIELIGGTGLRNPNPGTYPIAALLDYAPVGRWLLPDEDTAFLLPSATLCVRVEARDDFGLSTADLAIERSGAEPRAVPLLGAAAADAGPRKSACITRLFEMPDLLGGGTGGEGLALTLHLTDNCAPTAQSVDLPRRIVQIVDDQQLADAIAKIFRRLREEASQALDLQQDRRARLSELLANENPKAAEVLQTLSAIEVGQSRVLGSCERLHRGLMRAFDLHLWNHLEPGQNPAAVIALYLAHSETLTEPLAVDPTFYRKVSAARGSGAIGPMEVVLDPILQMIATADRLATTDAPSTLRNCTAAQVARASQQRDELTALMTTQARIADGLQNLLLRLQDWNDFQDMVQETRALRDRQRDLLNRTEEARGKK